MASELDQAAQERQPTRDIEKLSLNDPSSSSSTDVEAESTSSSSPPMASGKNLATEDIEKVPVSGTPVHQNENERERQAQIDARVTRELARQRQAEDRRPWNLVSAATRVNLWFHDTFPTFASVLAKLPFPLLPFAFAMFVLVEALVSRGWIDLFALGWDDLVTRTGTMGAIAGGGFLSVVLSNCTGTNIGTAILLCRIVQSWQAIHTDAGSIITNRTFWAAVYSMALGLNYGAYSSTFCASLNGLLWKDILENKGVFVGRWEFFGVNVLISIVGMALGCAVLAGEIYIIRRNSEYSL